MKIARAGTDGRRLEKYINYAGGGGGGLWRRDCKLVRIKVMNINHEGPARSTFFPCARRPLTLAQTTAAPPRRRRHYHYYHHHWRS